MLSHRAICRIHRRCSGRKHPIRDQACAIRSDPLSAGTVYGQLRGTMFEFITWGGAALSLAGLVGLIWCIFRVMKARKAGLSDDDLRAVVQGVLPWNLGSLFLSVIGLMLVILGISFG